MAEKKTKNVEKSEKTLVIVESPAKAKTIKKYSGSKDVEVLASYGHVRDLLSKDGAVDPDNDFHMTYQLIEKNEKHVDNIAKQLKKATVLMLATDPDREGEAIAWHLKELLEERGLLKGKKVQRVVFHEITKRAVTEAMANPRELSQHLIDAQLGRRGLDFLVGFKLSPLLWKKIRRGLSAGRVQSPALRLIVEREEAIEKFVSEEYWTIEADVSSKEQAFMGKLTLYNDEKVEQFTINNAKQATKVRADLLKKADGQLLVAKVEKKQRKRNPAAPFTTSTLQQEASRKLGFTTKRTMRIAQQLYEGIDVGEGTAGLITYMRTDSVNLAQEALSDIRNLITERYGKENVPESPRIYKTKSKNAQEAHEAIRPTSIHRLPDDLKNRLSLEQFKLYSLIWKRTVASQMIHATIDTVAMDLQCGKGNIFRANGSTIKTPGFITVYQEDEDDSKKDDGEGNLLPPLKKGDTVTLKEIRNEQHFTEPPPRYTEASLVKKLEEYGIGRPSTYASIISTLQAREYVELDKKRFTPTDVGRIVNRFLTTYFNQYVDYDFTAKLEDELDAIARGEKEWIPVLHDFWKPFIEKVLRIDETVERKDVTQEATDEKCPKCDSPVVIRLGRRGRFKGCTAYPECDYTCNLDDDEEDTSKEDEAITGRTCPQCDKPLVVRWGRYGKFIGCSGYPECKFLEPLEKPANTEVKCPECKKGDMLTRRSRRGKVFYSCEHYPKCKYATWNEPITEACPECQWPILTIKTTKRRGTEKVCPQKECNFAEPLDTEESNE